MLKLLDGVVKSGVAVVIAGIMICNSVFAQSTPAENIPEFTFYKMSGQPFARKDLTKDKKIVIIFFDITCDHCQQELKSISERVNEFKKGEFYLVSLDEVSGILAFMEKYAPKMKSKSNVTLLRDVNREFITSFLPLQYPALYIYGSDLKLIKYYGQNSKVSDIVETVNQ
jgi:peroxiredoxin